MAVLFCATGLLPKLNILNDGGTEGGDPKTRENQHILFYKTSLSIIKNKNSKKTAVSTTLCFSSKAEISTRKRPPTNQRKPPKKAFQNQFLSEGRENDETHFLICPGCGVFMQNTNPNLPGFFQKRSPLQEQEDDAEEEEDQISFEGEGLEQQDDELQCKFKETQEEEENEDNWWESEDFEIDFDDEEEELKKELDGFAPAGIGYGNVTEESMKKAKKERISKAEKKKRAREEAWKQKEGEELTVCARCHSLRNYGQIKNQKAENLIPDFDFDRLISTRLMKPTSNSGASVVVMVVDCVDFDGSFPKRAAKSLFRALEGSKKNDPKLKLPKLVLVATKVDLLPSQISPARLDKWVRNRAKANGAPKMNGVYLVSAHKDLGVRNLLSFIRELAGPRGNVWVIGAQNAGKSTLINMFAKKEGRKISKLTEAAVPGTTLGILRIGGILPAKAKMYDTPGLLHPYLMSMRLNRDEQKMVEIRKELRPRTYRIKAGQAIHVGALMRLDLSHASVQTIYVTIWASPNISLHLGKIENADEIHDKHAGIRLQPPIGIERVPELGKWEQKELKVSGNSWEVNSIDIAVAGLGWFSLGLKGEASLTLWTYEGVDVTLREPLVLDRAPSLERPGFLLPKAISDAIGNHGRLEAEKTRKVQAERNSLAEVIA